MVEVIIDNYIRVYGLPNDKIELITKRLTYPNPAYEQALIHSQSKIIRKIPKTLRTYDYDGQGCIMLPRGVCLEFLANLQAWGVEANITTKLHSSLVDPPAETFSLRSYQEKLIQDALLYPGPGFIIKAPPGVGKTTTALEYAKRLARKTLWITHTKELANQVINVVTNKDTLPIYGLNKDDVGVIGMGKFSIGNFLTVATVQTLSRRVKELTACKYEFGTIVIDECHHAPASSWNAGAHLFSPYKTIGLTATSYRADGLTAMLFDCVGPVAAIANKDLLIKEGVLVVPNYCVIRTGLTFKGSSHQDILTRIINSQQRNHIILRLAKESLEQNPYNVVIVLSGRVSHVDELTQLFYNHGLSPLRITGKLGTLDRSLAFEKLATKEPRLLVVTYDLLAEGFDYAPISHVILGTPFKNPIRLEQTVGRSQRIHPNKSDAYVFDLSDINRMLERQASHRRLVAEGLGMPVTTFAI